MSQTASTKQEQIEADFVADVMNQFKELESEIAERNQYIDKRDKLIYDDLLSQSLRVPIGHDKTPVNWLRRTVEVHKNMFMSRGFSIVSTYDTVNTEGMVDDNEKQSAKIENQKRKEASESRKRAIDGILEDNGGNELWAALADSASGVGFSVVKCFWDDTKKTYVISPVESVEHVYALWNQDNFRDADAIAYVFQVSKLVAVRDYGAPENVATSILGQPGEFIQTTTNPSYNTTQEMVTIAEVIGRVQGWSSKNGVLGRCKVGSETPLGVTIVGNYVTSVVDKEADIPKFYILPNKRYRRRPWGVSDISDAAVGINQTYIETLSDWRTVSAKVNFPKYKAYGFRRDATLPKYESRKVQVLRLNDGQDISEITQGSVTSLDFRQQMEELKEQFVRETGVSRVLFDDPSVTLNSNQALITSMKPTSDIAEAKKNLWTPILIDIFNDALDVISKKMPEYKELNDIDSDWRLRVMWPSLIQKEDPIYQQMLLNRKNANVISIQSYLEQQGESKEELDRIREEMQDPVTAAIHGNVVNQLALGIVSPPSDKPNIKTTVNLRGDLTPNQEANIASQNGFNNGPFPADSGPQGGQGLVAQENMDNRGYLTGNPYADGQPVFYGQSGQPQRPGEQVNGSVPGGNDGQQQANGQQATVIQNQEGQGVMSQPGSGATTTSPGGALNQANQQNGA